MNNLRIDARMALANYESSYAVFGADASFTMKEVHVIREYIDTLEAALRVICDGPRDADKSYPELLAEVRCEARAALEKK
jgi:hypothetical protein